MHCIQGSDAHRLDQDPGRESNLGIGDRPTEVLLPDMSFAALKALLTSNEFDRVRAFAAPPSDPVKAARLEGNTVHQAFHESAGTKRGQSAILRDVVAFTNSAGGRIFLGVSASEKRPIAGLENAKAIVTELSRDIPAQITPPVEVTFEELVSDGKPVVVLQVNEGAHKPHAVAPGGIFVRRDAESAQATRDEIVQMVTGAASAAPVMTTSAPVVSAPAPANGRARREPARQVDAASERSARSDARARAEPAAATEVDHSNGVSSDLNGSAPPGPESAEASTSADMLEIYEETVGADPMAPTTGIEVLDSYEQDGIRYYTLRDLRYHKLIHNVTKTTDRRLWRAAIAQREKGDLDESAVRWKGDYGLWRAAITQREKGDLDETAVRWKGDYGLWRSYRQRSGDRRYDLVFRGDGDPRIFFEVSESGMDDRWKAVLPPAKVTA